MIPKDEIDTLPEVTAEAFSVAASGMVTSGFYRLPDRADRAREPGRQGHPWADELRDSYDRVLDRFRKTYPAVDPGRAGNG